MNVIFQAHSLCTKILESLPEASSSSSPDQQMDSLLAQSEVFDLEKEQYKEKIKEMYLQLSEG